eukprot:CAMPEP_0118655154 /NCGR_PEP_ID=MMETSP0785-20121206/12770_1 /TAXON_ID=91992 /ORGANISM="Bolidomonas pacifica, Strain CCMP 1866" /LENGTH=144 /DNA_ID=CAMNT_0006547859 /DNA_START=294 /DNA_END=728 /DNA_ORIENTATION=+
MWEEDLNCNDNSLETMEEAMEEEAKSLYESALLTGLSSPALTFLDLLQCLEFTNSGPQALTLLTYVWNFNFTANNSPKDGIYYGLKEPLTQSSSIEYLKNRAYEIKRIHVAFRRDAIREVSLPLLPLPQYPGPPYPLSFKAVED